jgi:plasmid maintenance system antidote protein VapI
MAELTLKVWMDEKGYSNRQLAQELNLSYDIIYKMSTGKRPITDGFKWRFFQRFGLEEASRIFDVTTPTTVN